MKSNYLFDNKTHIGTLLGVALLTAAALPAGTAHAQATGSRLIEQAELHSVDDCPAVRIRFNALVSIASPNTGVDKKEHHLRLKITPLGEGNELIISERKAISFIDHDDEPLESIVYEGNDEGKYLILKFDSPTRLAPYPGKDGRSLDIYYTSSATPACPPAAPSR